MTETIQQSELRNNNAEIMRRVADGESFTITVHGRAVADLVPHQARRPRQRLLPAAEFDRLLAEAGPGPDPLSWAQDISEADRIFGDDQPENPWAPR
jgi:prevent-host-death family protein